MERRYIYKSINVRSNRGTEYKIVGHLGRGDVVKVDSLENDWYLVYTINGFRKLGYVYKSFLNKRPIPSFEIIDWNWRTDPSFTSDGSVIWNVKVRNNTKSYVEYLKVEFSTYDIQGRLITSDFTYLQGLSPGGSAVTKSYSTYFGGEQKASIRLVY